MFILYKVDIKYIFYNRIFGIEFENYICELGIVESFKFSE